MLIVLNFVLLFCASCSNPVIGKLYFFTQMIKSSLFLVMDITVVENDLFAFFFSEFGYEENLGRDRSRSWGRRQVSVVCEVVTASTSVTVVCLLTL